jgi:hypothetical protein
MSEGGREVFTLAQAMIWVCNALGAFATPGEINAIVDDFEPRAGKRERLMVEAFARLQSPRFRDDGEEIIEELSIFTEPALSLRWVEAHQAITKAAQKGLLKISGLRDGAQFEEVGPLDCRHIVFRDGDAPYAECAYDPNLKRRAARPRWEMVRFDAGAVIAMWPHPTAVKPGDGKGPPDDDATIRTGAPGRPSAMHLVVAEAERRRQSGEALKRIEAEARALLGWYEKVPGRPYLTTKTIANKIRDAHNRHFAKPRN